MFRDNQKKKREQPKSARNNDFIQKWEVQAPNCLKCLLGDRIPMTLTAWNT